MGQLRQIHCPVGTKQTITLRGAMLPPLIAGFMLSSFAVFAVTSAAGMAFRSTFAPPTNLLVAAALCFCVMTDLVFPRVRPTLFNRQTPRSWGGRFSAPITGLLWGMDTGTVVSTFRASAASWAALVLIFAGWGPWWAGITYGAAFCVPLTVMIATYPVAGGVTARAWRRRSTESLVGALGRAVRYVRCAAALTAAIGAALAVQSGF